MTLPPRGKGHAKDDGGALPGNAAEREPGVDEVCALVHGGESHAPHGRGRGVAARRAYQRLESGAWGIPCPSSATVSVIT